MQEFTYSSIKVQQTSESKPFYVTSIKAKELLDWCDVPRSKEGLMVGYQRDLDGREDKIKEFFLADPKNNIIPSAVIVAVDPIWFSVLEKDALCVLTVKHQKRTEAELLDILIQQFEDRLNVEEIASIAPKETSEGSEGGEGGEDGEDGEDGESDDADPVIPPQSYLAEITKSLRLMKSSPDKLNETQKKSIKDYMLGVAKPGLILDGQHRVFGAKEFSDFDIELPVVILPNLPPSEQVFHFYVVNNKAKQINRTHLRRIISTSLSKKEIDELYDRLKDAGVEAKSAEWTHRMNMDSDSPFLGLINTGLIGSNGVISENIAYQLISKFMLLKNRFPLLLETVLNWDITENDYRLSAFYAFWKGIKNLYPNAWLNASKPGAEDKDRQIFSKVSLIELQEYLLVVFNKEMPKRKIKKEPSPFADIFNLENEVGLTLAFLKEKFFLKLWKIPNLDTGRGHEIFQESINKALNTECKNLGNVKLFKG